MPANPAPAFRPAVEGLEDRLAPATFTVTNTKNTGAGSLRAAITAANAATGADTIAFNIAGTGTHTILPTSALPAITDAVTIDAGTQPGFTNAPLIVITGSKAGSANGLVIRADGCTVRGLVINKFARSGIVLQSDGNKIQTCYIGTNATATTTTGNKLDGVTVAAGSSGNTIGGSGTGNFIAGNRRYGVNISGDGADANVVASNSIGNNAAGGVAVQAGAENNTLGGTAVALSNVISANGNNGILITGVGTKGNTVVGNFVGTDSGGTKAIGNFLDGIAVTGGASENKIGLAGSGNLLSGNGRNGIHISGAGTTGNVVVSNFVGVTASGKEALGNGAAGVRVADGADRNTIGGSVAGVTNTIGGNKTIGVYVSNASGTVIRGNRIGIGPDGTTALGNASHGVFVTNKASNTSVGGVNLTDGNLIANNGGDGVLIGSDAAAGSKVAAGAGNSVLSTAFIANGGLGIDRGPNDGVNQTAIPVTVTAATVTTNSTKIDVTVSVTGPAGATYRVEVYSSVDADPSGFGEGRFLLGTIQVTTTGAGATTGTGSFQYATAAGAKIAATATDLAANDTSEFSAVFTAT